MIPKGNGEWWESHIQEVSKLDSQDRWIRCFSNCLGEFILSELVKQEDTMHILSHVFAFIAIQLIARSLDLTLHNNQMD